MTKCAISRDAKKSSAWHPMGQCAWENAKNFAIFWLFSVMFAKYSFIYCHFPSFLREIPFSEKKCLASQLPGSADNIITLILIIIWIIAKRHILLQWHSHILPLCSGLPMFFCQLQASDTQRLFDFALNSYGVGWKTTKKWKWPSSPACSHVCDGIPHIPSQVQKNRVPTFTFLLFFNMTFWLSLSLWL